MYCQVCISTGGVGRSSQQDLRANRVTRGESPDFCWGLVGNRFPRVNFGVKSPSFEAKGSSFV